MGSLLFLIYINNLPNELKINAKNIVKGINESANALNNDFSAISKLAFNSKMFFNAGPTKLAQEMLSSRTEKL